MSAWVYILRGSNGRHYIGSTVNLARRLSEHMRGHTYTTKRLGQTFAVIASRQFETLGEAKQVERLLKAKKNPRLAVYKLEHL